MRNSWRNRLHDLSYTRSGIWKGCLLCLSVGMLAAFAAGWRVRAAHEAVPMSGAGSVDSDWTPGLWLETWDWEDSRSILLNLYALRLERAIGLVETLPQQALLLPESEMQDAMRLLISGGDDIRVRVMASAAQSPPAKLSAYALALDAALGGEYRRAGDWALAEEDAYPDPDNRHLALEFFARGNDRDRLDALRERPEFRELMDGVFLMQLGIQQQDWGLIFRHFWTGQYSHTRPELVALALLVGLLWGSILYQMWQPDRPLRAIGLMTLALGLGAVSTWPTLWSMFWLDPRLGVEDSGSFTGVLLYYILSVGAREELCKLMLFAPFIPRLLKADRDLEALVLAGMVGLGFAVEENAQYFERIFSSSVATIRFLSANLLHFTFTGLAGLALVRWIRDPAHWMQEGLSLIAMVIGLHGLYDALLTMPVPGMGDMSYFAGTALAVGALMYFQEVNALMPHRARPVSLTALFFWGICLVFSLELLLISFGLPFHQALGLAGESAVSSIIFAFVFLHAVKEPVRG